MAKRGCTLANAIENSRPYIDGRGSKFCRGCRSEKLFSAINLGRLPIANELLFNIQESVEKFPLHLRICEQCGLGQVEDVVTPERFFGDYRYLSSMSTTFLNHASDYVRDRLREDLLDPSDWVLEIASNDGYLLKNFLANSINVIGVEPAENVAEFARGLGINTISEFFSSALASEILSDHGHPKLIIANNVVAHVPDLFDFMNGLSILAGPETIISIENPSLSNILLEMQFDTIYHEHYSYLSATSVDEIGRLSNLQLYKIEKLSTHGGSNRYWLRKSGQEDFVDESVLKIKNFESEANLFEPKSWTGFSNDVQTLLQNLEKWISEIHNRGGKIYGYGAAAKSSTLLNSINEDISKLILGVADLSAENKVAL